MSSPTNSQELDLAGMRRELDELRAQIVALRNNGHSQSRSGILNEPAMTDRRGMLKKVAGLAVGMAAVGLLKPTASRGSTTSVGLNGRGPIPNANGDPLLMGNVNTATSDTFVNQSVGSSFIVQNTSATVLDAAPLVGRNWASNLPALPSENLGVFGAIDARGSTTPDADIVGVYGSAITAGTGTAIGVRGFGSAYGGFFRGDLATARLFSSVVFNGDPTTDTVAHLNGELFKQFNGPSALWYCTDGGTPGTWRMLTGRVAAGALTLLSAPLRLVDTRTGSGFFDAGNHYTNSTARAYDIVSLSGGSVPAGSLAVIGRAVAVNETVGGLFRESPVNPPGTGSAIINFSANQVIGATFTSALDSSGRIFVAAALNSAGSADFILDIVGYYR